MPAYLMALASADIPGLVVTDGFRMPDLFDAVPLGQRDGAVAAVRLAAERCAGRRVVGQAEDMLQETLLAAWRGLGQYEGRASLRT